MKPIIGIMGISNIFNDKNVFFIYDNYRKAIIKYGGNPIMLLPPLEINYNKENMCLTEKDKKLFIDQIKLCNGIIIPGGSHILEHHKFICEYCNKKKIPLLGICMGMQTMCNYNNNNINLNVDNHNHDQDYTHYVDINVNSFLYQIIRKNKILVNSYHNYKVPNSGSYKIVGTNNDCIEAVEKDNYFNIGLQWHPEKNYDKDIVSARIFKSFINYSKR